MNKNKGLAPIIIIVILVLALVVAGVYVVVKNKKESTQNVNQNAKVNSNQNKDFDNLKQSQQAKDETVNWKTYKNDEYGFELKYPIFLKAAPLDYHAVNLDDFISGNYSSLKGKSLKLEVGFVNLSNDKTKPGVCFSVNANFQGDNNGVFVKNFPSTVWGDWNPVVGDFIINNNIAKKYERNNKIPDAKSLGCPDNFRETIYSFINKSPYLEFEDSRCDACQGVDFNQILSTFKFTK